jgi:serine/threonine protein kinase
MAPEQRDEGRSDARSDLYAVGIILFEMICGERPSGSDLPSHVREGLPSWVDAVFSRLYTRWDRRFGSAGEVLETIERTSAPPVVASLPRYSVPPPPRMEATAAGTTWCPECNSKIEPGDNFCVMCGTQVVAHPRRCASCGGFPDVADKFCIFCGTRLPAA